MERLFALRAPPTRARRPSRGGGEQAVVVLKRQRAHGASCGSINGVRMAGPAPEQSQEMQASLPPLVASQCEV